MTHGVVVGKFYPPHRGHRHLIDTAVSQSDRVTVMVVDGRNEDPPATLRMVWLRELHPDAEVILVPDIERDEDSEAWAYAARQAVGNETIDAVFDSEDYGVPWAKAISELQGSECRNVFVGRGLVKVSGTQVHPIREVLELPRRSGAWALREARLRGRRRVHWLDDAGAVGRGGIRDALGARVRA